MRSAALGAAATTGTACAPNGKIAASTDGSGTVLQCKAGTWQALGGGGLGIPDYDSGPFPISAGSITYSVNHGLASMPSYVAVLARCGGNSWTQIQGTDKSPDGWVYGIAISAIDSVKIRITTGTYLSNVWQYNNAGDAFNGCGGAGGEAWIRVWR